MIYKREAKKGFGDEIPKQVWAAAQSSIRNARGESLGRYLYVIQRYIVPLRTQIHRQPLSTVQSR